MATKAEYSLRLGNCSYSATCTASYQAQWLSHSFTSKCTAKGFLDFRVPSSPVPLTL